MALPNYRIRSQPCAWIFKTTLLLEDAGRIPATPPASGARWEGCRWYILMCRVLIVQQSNIPGSNVWYWPASFAIVPYASRFLARFISKTGICSGCLLNPFNTHGGLCAHDSQPPHPTTLRIWASSGLLCNAFTCFAPGAPNSHK